MRVTKDPTFISSESQKKRREGTKRVFKELMTENFLNVMKGTNYRSKKMIKLQTR